MNGDNHLPVYGVGPFLITAILSITLISIILSFFGYIPNYPSNFTVFAILGVILIVTGVLFWFKAVTDSNIQDNIKANKLVTTGIYARVRHPIYAAFLYAVTGIILIANNLTLIILPLLYWIILSIAMKKTEEKWLIDLYGDDYLKYSKKVNGFIPKVI
ncbi:methyltransferase family protein [Methanobrevibacter sp.]|uniref:methyltransferase family protein n=1 Tax=Methanobrevibacter sp. TaxID=66852 RepID=UPI003890B4D1